MAFYEDEKVLHEKVPSGATSHTPYSNNSDLPPPYEPPSMPAPGPSPAMNSLPPNPSQSLRSSGAPTLPCVIPQTHKPFDSPFSSPFTRAYPPSLAAHGIFKTDFLAFIDGLNEVFISHPVLKGVSAAGAVMSQFHGLLSVQYAGMGLQFASDISSAAASYLRTKAYFEACNKDLFHPVGLHAAVLTTRDMMAKVGHGEQWLRLLPLETSEDLDELVSSPMAGREGGMRTAQETANPLEDPRMRRLNALHGYVAPSDFDVPAVVAPDNLINKMAAWQAQKTAEKHGKKDLKRREKAEAKSRHTDERATMGERRLERKLEIVEKSLEKHGGDLNGKKVRRAQERYEREQRKVERKAGRKEGKSGKDERREEKKVNKIRWIVITQWEGEAEGDVDSDGEDGETGSDGSFSNLHGSR